MKLETKRLYIYPLSPKELRDWVRDLPALEHSLNITYEAEPMEGEFQQIVKGQLKITEEDCIHYYWHTFWLLIRKKDRVVVGSADFKSPPDEKGNIEIGYGLGKQFEGQGYMTEAVDAMCRWGLAQQGVSHIVAETELNAFRSQAVLKRCGFKCWYIEDTAWWICS